MSSGLVLYRDTRSLINDIESALNSMEHDDLVNAIELLESVSLRSHILAEAMKTVNPEHHG